MSLSRVVAPEMLDHLAADDPAARHSRRDLLRIHRVMGTRAIVARGWRALLTPLRAGAPLRILELGAGDGQLLLGVARRLAPHWPAVQLSLLDRQDIVTPATLAGFAALGWTAQPLTLDIRSWSGQPGCTQAGTQLPRWDLISATLFLHHFGGDELSLLLAAVAARGDRFFASEPSRSWLALAGSHLVGAIGANAVTRTDAVLSVRAGFRGAELAARWPQSGPEWQTSETAAGLFSHCFSAWRAGVAA